MDSDKDKQNSDKPLDYGFILNSSSDEKPRSNNKKMVAIILIIALLSVATVAYLLQSSNNNVQKTESNQTFSSQEIASQKEVAKNYIDLMTQESYSEARSLLATPEDHSTDGLTIEYKNYWKNVQVNTCKPLEASKSSSEVKIQCQDGSDPTLIIFKFIRDGSSIKIDSYSYIMNLGKPND